MSTVYSLHHQYLRPSILQILRAAGFHSTKPSVLDTLTDIAARHLTMLAQQTVSHAQATHENILEIRIEDVRAAMQKCGLLTPEQILADQGFGLDLDLEDTRGVDAFVDWGGGKFNKEIRRVAVEGGEEGGDDYLTVLKKKSDKTEDLSKYDNSILGKGAPARSISIEGSEVSSIEEWNARLRSHTRTCDSEERKQSSDLSSIGDQSMAEPESD